MKKVIRQVGEVILNKRDYLNEKGTSVLFRTDPIRIEILDHRVRIKNITVEYDLNAEGND